MDNIIEQYEQFVNQGWDLIPEHEGDILLGIGIRDEIHRLHEALSPSEKEARKGLVLRLNTLDRSWQSTCLRTKSPEYKTHNPNNREEWRFNLDHLDKLSEEQRAQI